MRLRADAGGVTERLEERLEPARERASEQLGEAGDRVREAVSAAPDVAERLADDVGDRSRAVAERLERYLQERFDERTIDVWGPRVAFAAGGLLVGFLLGWLLTRPRRDDRAEHDEGVAQAPRTAATTGRSPFQAVRSS